MTDPTGAAVTNAQVTLTNDASHAAQQAATNEAGVYSLLSVTPGTYTLTVRAAGFTPYTAAGVQVTSGEDTTWNVHLSLASAAQSVVVRGDAITLDTTPSVGKTDTRLEDIPGSVLVIGRQEVTEQGGLNLKDSLRNASGVGIGGDDGFGADDRLLIRGMSAYIYNDGFSDGDERNGIQHSLNGVERVEILEGPGSALFGSGPPGGTINLVHFTPSALPNYGAAFQTGSFGLVSGSAYLTGPTGVRGMNYRVDGLAQHEDGFRSLESADYELRPVVSWSTNNNSAMFVADGRWLRGTPDTAGLVYVNGTPITTVSRNAKYSTPFARMTQPLFRGTFTDSWQAASYLTVNNRFSYMFRNMSILRNGDGGSITGSVFSGRQLRRQRDVQNDIDFESEPIWRFHTGSVKHLLLTGFEAHHIGLHSSRATADLPNITNIFDPVVPETSTAGLVFLRDSKHSGDVDILTGNYFGIYATDQVDVTSRLKLRLSAREDFFHTTLAPQVVVPGRVFQGSTLIEPPATFIRNDTPFSGSAGVVYRLLPGISPYFGVSRSNLVTFSSESTQNGVQAPESALQYEAGIKMTTQDGRVIFTVAGFDLTRNNVFSLVNDEPIFNDQKTDGGEANLQMQVVRGWRLSANVTGQHAWLSDNPSAPADTGNRPQGVPEHIFNLWTSYDLPLNHVKGFNIAGGVTNRGNMFSDPTNTKSVPDFTTADAVVTYRSRSWNGSFGFHNLTDERFFIAANGGGGLLGDARSFFVSFHKTFGGER